MSTKYKHAKVVRKKKWIWGVGTSGKQPKGSRAKVNSKVEDTKKFFYDFKSWHDDPVRVSTQLAPSIGSDENESSPESQYEHPKTHKIPLVRVRHSPWSQTGPVTRSRSPSPMIISTPHTPAWSSETANGLYEVRLNDGDASLGSLQPSPQSAYSSTELLPRQGSSDQLIVREHHTEAIIPPQAAWAATVLRPHQ